MSGDFKHAPALLVVASKLLARLTFVGHQVIASGRAVQVRLRRRFKRQKAFYLQPLSAPAFRAASSSCSVGPCPCSDAAEKMMASFQQTGVFLKSL